MIKVLKPKAVSSREEAAFYIIRKMETDDTSEKQGREYGNLEQESRDKPKNKSVPITLPGEQGQT